MISSTSIRNIIFQGSKTKMANSLLNYKVTSIHNYTLNYVCVIMKCNTKDLTFILSSDDDIRDSNQFQSVRNSLHGLTVTQYNGTPKIINQSHTVLDQINCNTIVQHNNTKNKVNAK